MDIRLPDPTSSEYVNDYRNGWEASRRANPSALENADDRNVSHAWYDGYSDYAVGRPKWTYRNYRKNGPECGHPHCDVDCIDPTPINAQLTTEESPQ